MDKIFIHALKAEAIIGIFDWERQVRQTVIVDIEISADILKAALTDSIEDTLNYKRVAKRVLAFVEGSQFHLVETLAEHIAMLLLEEFGIAWVKIVLSKPGAVRNSRDVGVALERDRSHLERLARPAQRPSARCPRTSCSMALSPGARSPQSRRAPRFRCPRPRAAASRRRAALVQSIVEQGIRAYGVNTGVGALCDVIVTESKLRQLSRNIVMSHAVAVGPALEAPAVRAVIAAAINNFAHGYSGVRAEVVERLLALLASDCIPEVPAHGSVGYLAHMAHIALVLLGAGHARIHGERRSGAARRCRPRVWGRWCWRRRKA